MEVNKNEGWIVWLLAAVNFTNILDFMIMMPLAPQIKRVFSLDPTQWSLIVSSYTYAAFVSGILSVFIIDKFDRKTLLLFTYLGFAIGNLYCGLADSVEALMIARSIAGIFGGVLGALVMAIIADVIPFERRGAAMGKVMAGFSAAAALGVPFGLFLGVKYGWQIPFYVTSGASVIILILMYFKIPSIKGHLLIKRERNVVRTVALIFSSINKNRGFLFMSFLILGQFTIIPFLSPYMVANVGFREDQLTYIYLIGGLCTVFTSPIIGKLSDKHGNAKIFSIFLILSLIPTILITHLEVTPVWMVLIVTSMFFVFAGGRMIPGMAIIMATAEPEVRGVFMSVRSAVQQLASGIAASFAGAIIVENASGQFTNYNMVGYLAAFFSLATLLIVRKINARH